MKDKKRIYRIFHVINCYGLEIAKRADIYSTTHDKNKPDLFVNHPFGIRPSDANKLRMACAEELQNLLNCAKRGKRATMLPRMTGYIFERQNINDKTPISRCSEEETIIATELLLEVVFDENLPFSV